MSTSQKDRIRFSGVVSVITALYIAQGLPGGLIGHALPAILREQGVGLALIGLLKLLALPWLLKFIWAPFVDGSGGFQRRYKWILAMQVLSACSLFILSFLVAVSIEQFVLLIGICLLCVNLFSATQDIATDGITASITPKEKLGLANSIQVVGYKLGMIAGGSGLLYLSAYQDMPSLVRLMAIGLLVLLIPIVMQRKMFNDEKGDSPTINDANSSGTSFRQVYKGLFRSALFIRWLPVLLTYKIADSLGSSMLKPMLVDTGYSLANIGEITFYSSLIGLAGAGVAGFLYRYIGQVPALFGFGVLQTLSISSFYFVANGSVPADYLQLLVIVEQFCDGLSTVALFAVMMSLCRPRHEGADYTLQASIQIVLAGIIGALSGLIAQYLSYASLYLICAVFGALSLWFVLSYGRYKSQFSNN